MSANIDTLFHAALALPAEAREELAERLLRSLDNDPDLGLSPEWEAEIERRVEEVRKGEVELIPADEAFRSILERIRSRKRS